jgi:hypothetical protein
MSAALARTFQHEPGEFVGRQIPVDPSDPGSAAPVVSNDASARLDIHGDNLVAAERLPRDRGSQAQPRDDGVRDAFDRPIWIIHPDDLAIIVDPNEHLPAARVREGGEVVERMIGPLALELDLFPLAKLDPRHGNLPVVPTLLERRIVSTGHRSRLA